MKDAQRLVGSYIRQHVLPPGMSVTEAAKRLGVGRPALSNLLNGKSALSVEMAVRLERVFGADRNELLQLQADSDRRSPNGREIVVRPYVPPYLQITSRQIDAWADQIEARHMLPVLLRLLIVSTHEGLSRVTFPGHDDAQRHGWDGLVEADSATPWIPKGHSCWEFGTNRRPTEKASNDYNNSLQRRLPFPDRGESTFVFVTPRRWDGATDWAAKRQLEGHWKAVKALDASDLETWLTQSIPAQTWFAEHINIDTDGVETLERFWHRWSSASTPKLTSDVFGPSLEAYRDEIVDWLVGEPERPFVISADSKGEAIAFLACLFREIPIKSPDKAAAARSIDLAAVFDLPSTLRKVAASRTAFLPIVRSKECERELAPIHRRLHCVTVRPRNAVDSDPNIALDLLNHGAFSQALTSMGIERDRVQSLERESGRSPTILRRRLSSIDAIREPRWAEDEPTARALIPLTLVGAWNSASSADRKVVSTLASRPYEQVETDIAKLLLADDSPVWAAGQHRGVASKLDALFAIRKRFIGADLSRFFIVAHSVLAEADPALELPENKRWAAGLYGKVRHHSTALRSGICETLVILAVHGNHLFLDWLGVDAEMRVKSLVRKLLTPLTLENLLSHDSDLPSYAEAAQGEFLQLIEDDLRSPCPTVLGLLKPADRGLFSGCPRTGLLWALECLAWKHLARVSTILSHLSRIAIDDNWANTPINSLKAIYSSWLPQTAASLEDRKRAITALSIRFPEVAWQVCLNELPDGTSKVGHFSYRPRWRSDATGAGTGVTYAERSEFLRHVLDMVHGWSMVGERELRDIVRHVAWIPRDDQDRVWDRIIAWGCTQADDRGRTVIRETIRRWYLTRVGQVKNISPATIKAARRTFESLEPRNIVIRHQWLFSDRWIEPSAEDVDEQNRSTSSRQAVVRKQRRAAIAEIWESRGPRGVISFLAEGASGHVVGTSLAPVIPREARATFLMLCLDSADELAIRIDACMQGFLWALTDEQRKVVLKGIIENTDQTVTVRLLRCAPFRIHTWRLVARVGPQVEETYWASVTPQWEQHSELELTELINRLLQAGRPRSAFWVASREWALVETSLLRRLLFDLNTVEPRPTDPAHVDAFDVNEAFKSLNERTGVNPDDMAALEFMYLDVIDNGEYGLPNLEKQLASSPELYFRALTLAFSRHDHGNDPADWRIDGPKRSATIVSRAYKLLDRVSGLPGANADGTADLTALLKWVAEVRRLCGKHDRTVVGDRMIGGLLARIDPVPEDGLWPRMEVCEVLERTATKEMGSAFCDAVHNARGVQIRGEDGDPERRLSGKFRKLARQQAFSYPFVSSVLEHIASSYDQEARWHDLEGEVRKRLE